ncbi:hypothetical protein D0Z00_000681 [Geotrichum galactomycetum]|uniref:Uncharacterized protein n=1 Tax=Geotrichum galactomycetum TaxID=27317 RepID=A0ACB6V981_9ASCO|nr:hypothetical protein D0Z00_000681 [Geotrichum candidum]
MITPKFSIRQDANRLYITIYLPHIRASTDIEFQVDSNVFIFSLSPYYLRLRFSHALLNDEDERVIDNETLKSTLNYNASDCTVEISIAKETPGQEFEDLDLLTKLLARAKNPDHRAPSSSGDVPRPLIQEIGGDNNNPSNQDIDAHFSRLQSEAEEFDWELPQTLPTEEEDAVNVTGKAQYGFNRQYSGEIGVTMATGANDVNEYPEPEQSVPGQRAEFRAQLEALAFDADYYLADTFDNPDIAELIRWKSPTNELFSQFIANNNNNDDLIKFTEEEQQAMTRLPKKQYFLDNPKRIYLVRKVPLEKGDILAAFDVVELEEAAREVLAEQAAAEGN